MEELRTHTRPIETIRAPARLHAGNAKQALSAVVAAPGSRVVFDLADTIAIDSTALGEIVKLHRKLLASAGEVVLASVSVGIRRVLGITRVDTIFKVYPDAESAALGRGNAL